MLGFFRRYEKTFLLLLFAPALISLGVTGAMVSVLSDPGDVVVGHLFGEEVSSKEFDEARRLYASVNRVDDPESVWRFMAFLEAADRAGVAVSPKEVGEEIRSSFKWEIAQYLAEEELKAQGVDINSEEGRQEFNRVLFQKLSEAEFDFEIYKDILKNRYVGEGGHRAYEEQRMRSAKVTRLLEVMREAAAVQPDEVWRAFQEQHHRRVAEVIRLDGSGYAPDPSVTDPADPRFVSDEEVRAFYEQNPSDFDIERQVDVEYVAFPVEAAKFEAVVEEAALDLEAQKQRFQEQYVATGVAAVGSFADFQDQVRQELLDLEARRRVDDVMNALVDKVAAAEREGKNPDLATYRDQVQAELETQELIFGSTGLVTADELAKHRDIGSFPAVRWFNVSFDEDEVSDVLVGRLDHRAQDGAEAPEVWFVLRSRDIRPARTPQWEEIKDQAREAYAFGTLTEQKRHYDLHKNQRYLRKPGFRIEVATADDAAFGGDHEAARKALEQALEVAQSWEKGSRMGKFETDPGIEEAGKLDVEEVTVEGGELDEHPILGSAATLIRTSPRRGQLSRQVHERKDGAGWFVYRVAQELPQQVQPFDEVKARVAQDIQAERGMERAAERADAILEQLRGLTGEELTQALQESGLEAQRTEPFARDATSLEDIPGAEEVVSSAYSPEAEVGGGYFRIVEDPEANDVYLLRVAEKVDAPQEDYADRYTSLREDLLTKVRSDFATRQSRQLLLRAKGLPEEHLDYAVAVRDGPEGATGLKLRQVFLPPDQGIIDAWLEEAARKRMQEVTDALAAGDTWNSAVDRFSEDENTKAFAGALPPLGRGDLAGEYGIDFEEAVFDLPLRQTSAPIESKRGLHLVQKTEQKGGKAVFRHILIRTSPEARAVRPEDREAYEARVAEARAASRKTMEAALARLEGGESFKAVARSVGSPDDPYGQGRTFEVDWVTSFERVALGEPLEWEAASAVDSLDDLTWVPEAREVDGAWHLFANERSRRDQAPAWDAAFGRPRAVYHLMTESQGAMDGVRGELAGWLEDQLQATEDRPPFAEILKKFQELARKRSKAPSAGEGGAVGVMELESEVRAYGARFVERVMNEEVAPGRRTGVFESDAGFHIVEVVEVIRPDDAATRRAEVADALLEGTDW